MRALGYCDNKDCEDFIKGVFLLNHSNKFYCPRCRHLGFIEPEDRIDRPCMASDYYNEVRVEFNFNPVNGKYENIGVVLVDDMTVGGTYTLKSPLIRTEARALKVAESMLCALNSGVKDPSTVDSGLSIDLGSETFTQDLAELKRKLDIREQIVFGRAT